MSASRETFTLRARWILPVDHPPLDGGLIAVQGGRIVSVGEGKSSAAATTRDLGDVAVIPGLVNTHTHLEFSALAAPLGDPRRGFPAWIEEVVAARRAQAEQTDQAAARNAAVRRGLEESLRHGTIWLGEIATRPWSAEPFQPHPTRGTLFHEILGLAPDRVEPLLQTALDCLAANDNAKPPALPGWTTGWSPHAPYTVHFELLRGLIDLSVERRVPLAMHLAESLEELELLQSHSGPLVETLRRLDAWYPEAIPRGIEPCDYLDLLAREPRSLAIHGNYFGPAEFERLARHRERLSVVYCPRTHAFFGHARYPLREMLEAGARVALGTDSRASNPDLSLLEELRFAARQFPDVAPERLLRMATLAGAEALGVEQHTGSITVGKRADLLVLKLPRENRDDPYGFLRGEPPEVVAVAVGGRFAHSASASF